MPAQLRGRRWWIWRSRLRIWLSKHYETRRYLNLDDEANPYRYIPLRDLMNERSTGRDVRHRDLRTALFRADLHVLDANGRFSSFAIDDWSSSTPDPSTRTRRSPSGASGSWNEARRGPERDRLAR